MHTIRFDCNASCIATFVSFLSGDRIMKPQPNGQVLQVAANIATIVALLLSLLSITQPNSSKQQPTQLLILMDGSACCDAYALGPDGQPLWPNPNGVIHVPEDWNGSDVRIFSVADGIPPERQLIKTLHVPVHGTGRTIVVEIPGETRSRRHSNENS